MPITICFVGDLDEVSYSKVLQDSQFHWADFDCNHYMARYDVFYSITAERRRYLLFWDKEQRRGKLRIIDDCEYDKICAQINRFDYSFFE